MCVCGGGCGDVGGWMDEVGLLLWTCRYTVCVSAEQ